MAEQKNAAHPARPSWNKDEWAAKAKEKDSEAFERAKEAESALAQGKKPRHKPNEDIPKPTKALEARAEDLNLNKNLNKTMLVQTTTTGQGPRGAGFYCEMCNRTFKDSLSYLDHVNGRTHLAKLGQTTQVSRSTLSQVRAKIASLREESSKRVTAQNFDFAQRLKSVRESQNEERSFRKQEKKRRREERRKIDDLGKIGIYTTTTDPQDKAKNGDGDEGKKKDAKELKKDERDAKRRKKDEDELVELAQRENDDMAAMMGFGGFGAAKKR